MKTSTLVWIGVAAVAAYLLYQKYGSSSAPATVAVNGSQFTGVAG